MKHNIILRLERAEEELTHMKLKEFELTLLKIKKIQTE